MVLNAIILFKSLAKRPLVAAINAVVEPIIVIINKAVLLYSKIGDILINK